MTEVTRHPNCRCGPRVGDNPYCIIHGRIRDMDAGASPFVDVDALAAEKAAELGIEEEDIDRTQDTGSYIEGMHRDNLAADLLGGPVMGDQATEDAINASFESLKQAGEAEPGCICDYSQDLTQGFGGPVKRHVKSTCPVHGNGPRQDYDVEGEAEEL